MKTIHFILFGMCLIMSTSCVTVNIPITNSDIHEQKEKHYPPTPDSKDLTIDEPVPEPDRQTSESSFHKKSTKAPGATILKDKTSKDASNFPYIEKN